MCNLLPFTIVFTNLDLDKANGEFLLCNPAAGCYTKVGLGNATEYSKNESNAFGVTGLKTESKGSYHF